MSRELNILYNILKRSENKLCMCGQNIHAMYNLPLHGVDLAVVKKPTLLQ